MSAQDKVRKAQSELLEARQLRDKRSAESKRAIDKAANLKTHLKGLTNKLVELRSRIQNAASLTSALRRNVEEKTKLAASKETATAELEKKAGLAGIDPTKALRAPGQSTAGTIAQQYAALVEDERNGRVSNGAAFQFYQKNKGALGGLVSSTSKDQSSSKAPAGANDWGSRIVRDADRK